MKPTSRVLLVVLGLMLSLALGSVTAQAGKKPCVPLTCEDLGVQCGVWSDGCGGTIDCGACPDGLPCVEGYCGGDTTSDWTVPECSRISGTGAVSYTTDDGATITGASVLRQLTYTYGLTTLDAANTLLATVLTSTATTFLKSEDAGCRWTEVGQLTGDYGLLLLTAAPGGGAYAWGRGRSAFFKYDGENLLARTAPRVVYGLAVDPLDAEHIRIGTADCQLYESFDGGVTFSTLGAPAGSGSSIFYTVEFNPQNWDEALCGCSGAWRTTDAGQSWSAIVPFDLADIDLVYLFSYSPSNPQRVWARANMETLTSATRTILVSNDGGATFAPALTQGATATDQNGVARTLSLTNQPTMAAHAGLADVLYVVFGTYFNGYGTDLFRFDAGTGELTVNHTDGLDGIDAIAFSPADPAVMYLGLEKVIVSKATVDASAEEASGLTVSVSPNPFNPSTKISFNLSQAALVKLEVYNIAGQQVDVLLNDYLSAGDHQVSWDGSNVASGVYLYRLQAGGEVKSDKMLLLK